MSGKTIRRGGWLQAIARGAVSLALSIGLLPLTAFAAEPVENLDSVDPILEPHVADEVIVVYGAAPGDVRAFSIDPEPDIESFGYEIDERLGKGPIEEEQAVVASVPEGKSVEDAIVELEGTPGIAYAQPNYEYSLFDEVGLPASGVDGRNGDVEEYADALASADARAKTNDPYCNDVGSDNQWYLWSSEVPQAWDLSKSESSVSVAVLDTGCRLDHEDLSGVIDKAHAYDAYADVPLAASSVNAGDNAGHGTHVCGIVGAGANNGVGIAGTSYNANVIPVKVFSDEVRDPKARTSDIMRAYDYLQELIDTGAVSNLRVVNMSLGYYSSKPSETDRQLEQRIGNLRDRGVLTVCAGGNGDASGNPRTDKSIPADLDQCVSVTSLDRDGGNSYWSDYNQFKDISAPGELVLSTTNASAGSYSVKSGTSMASPIVAGAACLVFSANPDLSVEEAIAALTDNADPVVDPVHDRQSVSGSKGALNAEASVRAVLGESSEPEKPGSDRPEPEKPEPVKADGERLAGAIALDTMVAITKRGFSANSCNAAVVATVDGYWDALSASSFAGLNECPILLTDGAALSSQTSSEIKRLGVSEVYLAGGPAAVSTSVEASIRKIAGVKSVKRLAGETAVGTALEVYNAGKGHWGKTAIVATSATFQDALSISPFAFAKHAPVFLANATTKLLDPEALEALKAGGFQRVIIVGGTMALSSRIESDQLKGVPCVRLSGPTAYETSGAIAEWCLAQGMTAKNIGIATGESYYDALTGAAFCGKNNEVLVLVADNWMSNVDGFVKLHKGSVEHVHVFGGPAAVSNYAYHAVMAALG
ncbi:S8 family serine peptidase [Eggerthella lenta]|uniref:S8 family serine peptidase n=1 Tax=Eggerthella lenta TaxID=84112 RepID=UPI001305314E|nr:S8 family serine peptidase [Eggerthella lenta]